jgi:hypothetical protein
MICEEGMTTIEGRSPLLVPQNYYKKISRKWNIQSSLKGTIKKSQRLYASNATITKLWLALITRLKGSTCTKNHERK